uniref:Uncharacterized protein n=1 Tax=Rhizophora mucronata TaxID=61149 RepID=A0A2P2NGX9_RHIMU
MGWLFNLGVEGIWGGMILGGTAIQTVILAIITIKCDWEKEVQHILLSNVPRFYITTQQ